MCRRSAECRSSVLDSAERQPLARLDGLALSKAKLEAKGIGSPCGAEVPSPAELTQVVEQCARRR
jgi:hypothetical protein